VGSESTHSMQVMTGTWRDTLFVWQGNVTKMNDTTGAVDASSKEEEEHLEWKGTWVGCQECPDAWMAPNPVAFQASEMVFQVTGKGTNQEEGEAGALWKFELTGGSGWDLGEGDEKKRHSDHSHSVLMKFLPWESTWDQTAIVAVGENDFGAFVSAGFGIGIGTGEMVLGRRYLDEGDERAEWSVEELYDRVTRTDVGTVQMVLNNDRSQTRNKREASLGVYY
jgi:hypothetical protein